MINFKPELKEFTTISGESILYTGNPDLSVLERLSEGPGDIWHSSFEQGYKNAFPELVYQTAVLFWYLNDFDGLQECISWRINPDGFAVRKSVWEITGGFDPDFENYQMAALDFGFRSLRFLGAIPLYVCGLFTLEKKDKIVISSKERHLFYRKNFKSEHSVYMIFRLGIWRIQEWNNYINVKKQYSQRDYGAAIPPRVLKEMSGSPTVSYIIPTMFRQDYTLQLLEDLKQQSYQPAEVIIVDATPEDQRREGIYEKDFPFNVRIIWQQSKGSCRARNEAINVCIGDYIIFGDDDIRIPADFIENHIRLLQTYNAGACNGLDIRADNESQDLSHLNRKLDQLQHRWKVGASINFSNANSCVKREHVNQLVGNDINFDGGYGEDSDFGLSLAKAGVTVLFNPFSANLHLKPPAGGYRWWGTQAKITGRKRKKQPWELDEPVTFIRPVPSPTVMYGVIKQFSPSQVVEYRYKNMSYFLLRGSKLGMIIRILQLPYKNLQFNKSLYYAKKLLSLGTRHQ